MPCIRLSCAIERCLCQHEKGFCIDAAAAAVINIVERKIKYIHSTTKACGLHGKLCFFHGFTNWAKWQLNLMVVCLTWISGPFLVLKPAKKKLLNYVRQNKKYRPLLFLCVYAYGFDKLSYKLCRKNAWFMHFSPGKKEVILMNSNGDACHCVCSHHKLTLHYFKSRCNICIPQI